MLVLLAPVPAVLGMASRTSAARRFASPRTTRAVSAAPVLRAARAGRPLWHGFAAGATTSASAGGTRTLISDDPSNNVTPYIEKLVGRNLHLIPNHPLFIIKRKIEGYFAELGISFEIFDSLDPVVTCTACFDDLNIPPGHPARKPSDTYYLSEGTLLRTHTSAHQSELMRRGHERFLCTGDVYRRDEIDASHYPAFHQMEGVRLMDVADMPAQLSRDEWLASDACARTAAELKGTLEGLVDALFGPVEKRWVEAYFPFTEPSLELEIFFQGDWLEVLGCGVIHSEVLAKCGLEHRHGWAFGLGLERLAMILFSIPDIRLFWTEDTRFTSQFASGEVVKFQPYSKYPECYKDVAFFVPETWEENDFMELCRECGGDLMENVKMIDEFTNPKSGKRSLCYRIVYRSMDRSLTNEEVDEIQFQLREKVGPKLGVELR
ncbi:hypothetical protein KFE25_001368 [Diacronema lutheri]|uniref:phenylalanine--tRNA ligase n=2 Tax=Diacronema lutheri TaxID=2081491 RepID=A0A8J6C9M5_DIALT|nr:hypothetical protein KFE25_001368 [Diacronema lutheri]